MLQLIRTVRIISGSVFDKEQQQTINAVATAFAPYNLLGYLFLIVGLFGFVGGYGKIPVIGHRKYVSGALFLIAAVVCFCFPYLQNVSRELSDSYRARNLGYTLYQTSIDDTKLGYRALTEYQGKYAVVAEHFIGSEYRYNSGQNIVIIQSAASDFSSIEESCRSLEPWYTRPLDSFVCNEVGTGSFDNSIYSLEDSTQVIGYITAIGDTRVSVEARILEDYDRGSLLDIIKSLQPVGDGQQLDFNRIR